VTQALEWFQTQEVSREQTAEQPKEMRTKICVFARTAKCGEERGPSHEWYKNMSASKSFPSLMGENCQHTNDRKDRRRKTDKLIR